MSSTSRRLFPAFAAVLALTLSVALLPVPAQAQAKVTAFAQAVAEAAAGDDDIAAYYRDAGYEPIWTGEGAVFAARRAALLRAVQDAGNHALPADLYDPTALAALLREVDSPRDMGRAEVELSKLFLTYARDVQTGILTPGKVDDGIKRVVPLHDRTELLQSFAAAEPSRYMRELPPQSAEYAQLMKEKMRLELLLASGGWGPTVDAKSLKPGATGPAVIALRNRLIAMGYLNRSVTMTYDADIQRAVQIFQTEHGLEPDGVAGEGTLEEINTPVADRLASVMVAMERERWMNIDRGDRYIWVNLTDFTARIVDGGKITFETRSVIGARSHDRRSPEFSDMMEHMIVNPSWSVPRSIVVKEYLPQMQQNPGAAGHLQLINASGQVVSRENIDFTQFTTSSFPYALRQPPSGSNALGLVKFMFPNKYNIYLHDTPAKSLFGREVRAFSHGCIRLQQPFDFAYALLAPQTDDPEGVFHAALNSGRETKIDLVPQVPVHLVYRTAFTDTKGVLNFRRDIYGRDANIWSALQAAGVVLGDVQG